MLSPYLFVIVMEAFSQIIEKVVGGACYLTTCQVGGRGRAGEEISHLLFAYDNLIFCEAS